MANIGTSPLNEVFDHALERIAVWKLVYSVVVYAIVCVNWVSFTLVFTLHPTFNCDVLHGHDLIFTQELITIL